MPYPSPRKLGACFVLLLGAGLGSLGCNKQVLAPVPNPDDQVDVFSQVSLAQSDILWIVDDSGSMAREQDQLAESFPKFFAHLQTSNIDYRLAVTTTDIFDQAGSLVGMPAIIVGNSQDPLVPDTSDAAAAFASNIHVGTQGSARDEAFESAQLALEKLSASALYGLDAGTPIFFLRPKAALFLIFVGDGSEYSPGYGDGGPQTSLGDVRAYWRTFEQIKGIGNQNLVSVSAIAGDVPNGCAPVGCGSTTVDGGLTAAAGFRYDELVELAGGIFGSICDCNFDATLDALGLQALGLRRKFTLSRTPDTANVPIAVTVNYPCGTLDPADTLLCDGPIADTCTAGYGAACTSGCSDLGLACTVPAAEASDASAPSDGWTYNTGDNSITFTGATIPTEGSSIQVTYSTGAQ